MKVGRRKFDHTVLCNVMLRDRDCEARCESTSTTAQRILHSEYGPMKQCQYVLIAGNFLRTFTEKQGNLQPHSTQCVTDRLEVFGRCVGIAKRDRSNRKNAFSTDMCPATTQV